MVGILSSRQSFHSTSKILTLFFRHGGSVDANIEKAPNTQDLNGIGAKSFSSLRRMRHWRSWHRLLHQAGLLQTLALFRGQRLCPLKSDSFRI